MPNKENSRNFLNVFIEVNILLILFCLPFSKSIIEICVTLAILAFLIKKVFVEKKIRVEIQKNVLIAISAFVLFNALSLVNSQYIYLSLPAFFSKVLKWVFLFIIIADTLNTKAHLKRIFITMLLSATLILIDAFYQQYITGIDFLHYPGGYPVFKFFDRAKGATTFPTASFPFPNDFAAWINVLMFTFLSTCLFDLKNKAKARIAVLCVTLVLGFFLFLTTVRGAFVGTAIAFCVLILTNIRRFIVPVVLIFLVLSLVIGMTPYLRTYLKDSLQIKLSLEDRARMWSTGWEIFKVHPVLGNGVNTFFENYKNFRNDEDRYKRGSYAHNCFLQMAADTGILGLGAFLVFVFQVLFINLRCVMLDVPDFRRSFVFGVSLGVIAFLAHSFFDTNLYSLNLAALFWVSMGFIHAMGSCYGRCKF